MPVVTQLQRRGVDCVVIATAQHRELLDDVLRVLPMRVDHDLNVMRHAQSPADVVGEVLRGLSPVLRDEKPDVVLVQGDTASTFAAALAAFYVGIPVAHVEAGLRTYDLRRPYPEEGNRKMVTQIAALHFAPTENAKNNLLRERVPEERVFVTGNTVVDVLLETVERLEKDAALRQTIEKRCEWLMRPGRMLLVTVHRRESFGEPMRRVFTAFRRVVEAFEDVFVVYPVHPNPDVRRAARETLEGHERVVLTEPLDYPSFVLNMARAHLILTDSGGVQEEAPSLDKPVLILREVTERPEAVEAGCARLVGTETGRILSETATLLRDREAYAAMASADNPFGDGKAAERIVDLILSRFGVDG